MLPRGRAGVLFGRVEGGVPGRCCGRWHSLSSRSLLPSLSSLSRLFCLLATGTYVSLLPERAAVATAAASAAASEASAAPETAAAAATVAAASTATVGGAGL